MSDANGDRMLDHEYDGIREYDNPLPFWWVALFWVTILFSGVYFVYYQMGTGPSLVAEYNQDMLRFYDLQAKALLAAGPISDSMIAGLQSKPDLITGAKQAFGQRCAVCHGKNGEGNIGPNLTDDYWLHGGRLTQIYTTISEGVPAKGMLTWKNTLGPAEMLGLAAYVGTLHGTNPPNPKAPQGDKYVPESPASAATAPPPGAAPVATSAVPGADTSGAKAK